MAAPRNTVTTVAAPSRTVGEILDVFGRDMDHWAELAPPLLGQSIRTTVETLRTDLEKALAG